MKIFNKILLVIVSVIAIYAAGLIASDISSISEKISLLKIEFIPIILLVRSILKPFMTDITIIIAATPKLIPTIENNEKIEIYPSDFLEKRNLIISKRSDFENI